MVKWVSDLKAKDNTLKWYIPVPTVDHTKNKESTSTKIMPSRPVTGLYKDHSSIGED